MPEISVVGEGIVSTWGWEIALYLFLGGLTAGLLVLSGVMRLARPRQFQRALVVADLAGLPLLAVGMLCLLLDLSNKLNLWRFYTSFQITSVMSWGAWILLFTMVLLALRFVGQIPEPKPAKVLGRQLFVPPPASDEEGEEKPAPKKSGIVSFAEWAWMLLHKIGSWTKRNNRLLAVIGVFLGTGLGFYTGVFLSTIPARPLWNTAVLAPLFLISGLASAGAFLCLFLPEEEHKRLVPLSVLFCAIEMLLLLAFGINLAFGTNAVQRAGSILFNGAFGWAFWGLVILAGLMVPFAIELMEALHRRIRAVPMLLPPILKLVGSLALRFVIVSAGLLSFI